MNPDALFSGLRGFERILKNKHHHEDQGAQKTVRGQVMEKLKAGLGFNIILNSEHFPELCSFHNKPAKLTDPPELTAWWG